MITPFRLLGCAALARLAHPFGIPDRLVGPRGPDAAIRSWHNFATRWHNRKAPLPSTSAILRENPPLADGTDPADGPPIRGLAMKKHLLFQSSSACLLLVAGCSGSPGGETSSPPALAQLDEARIEASAVPVSSLGQAVLANNAFAVDLYSRFVAGQASSNVLTSPVSASLALTMAYAGAQGQTATEMASALHFDAGWATTIFEGQNALSQALASRGGAALATAQGSSAQGKPAPAAGDYNLQVVNSVWGQKTYPWAQPFLGVLAQSYGTGVYLEDFANDSQQALQTINGWVSSLTNDKINNLLSPDSVDNSTRMVLVNAIHLKFPWSTPFNSAYTASGEFTREDGTTIATSFMSETSTLPFVDDGQAQIVGLPLSNGQLSVVIALPHPGVDLATYEAGLSPTSAAITQPATPQSVTLTVPKSTFTSSSFSLSAALKAMGMVQAFDPASANFSGMCTTPSSGLYVSDVLQKATISMAENGVEAAAATAVAFSATAYEAPALGTVAMVVNRPYLIAVVDLPTSAILFLGHLVDPTNP